MKRAYSYRRWSSAEQSKGDSLRRQTRAAEQWAAANGYELDKTLRMVDAGVSAYSGRNLAEGGALAGFRTAIEQGRVRRGSVLLVEAWDRISRQGARKTLRIAEEIIEAGVDIVTLGDGKRYTAESLDTFDLVQMLMSAIIAREDSARRGMRVKQAFAGKRINAKPGQKFTSNLPSWLRADEKGKVTIDPDRGRILKRIIREHIGGTGLETIANNLTVEGIPCFGKGRKWYSGNIRTLLRSPALVGTHVGRPRDGSKPTPIKNQYPALIDAATWAKLKRLRKTGKPGRVSTSPLAYLVRCWHCDGAFTSRKAAYRAPAYLVHESPHCGHGAKRAWLWSVAGVVIGAVQHMATTSGPHIGKEAVQIIRRLRATAEQAEKRFTNATEALQAMPSKELVVVAQKARDAYHAAQDALQDAHERYAPGWTDDIAELVKDVDGMPGPATNRGLRLVLDKVLLDVKTPSEGRLKLVLRSGQSVVMPWHGERKAVGRKPGVPQRRGASLARPGLGPRRKTSARR